MPLINDLIPCGKGGIELDGFIREYQVQAGENISAGDFVEYVTNMQEEAIGTDTNIHSSTLRLWNMSVLQLSEDKVFIAYSYDSSYNYLYGVVCTISGTTITRGSTTQLSTSKGSGYGAATVLDSQRVFIAYSANYSEMYGMICTIDDTTITVSANTDLGVSSFGDESLVITALSSSKVFIHYWNGDQDRCALTCTISGTTITAGAEFILSNAIDYARNVITLDDSRVFLLASSTKYSSDFNTTGVIFSINGTTITEQAYVAISSLADSGYTTNWVVKLSSNKVLAIYNDNTNSKLMGRICNISGSSVTLGTETTLATDFKGFLVSGVALDSNNVLIDYGFGSSYYLYCMQCSINGNTITVEKNTQLNSSAESGYRTRMTLASDNKVFIAHGYNNTNEYLRGIVYQPEYTSPPSIIPYDSSIFGIANGDGSGGDTIEVWQPYYTYKKYTVSSSTTTTTGYVESKSSSTSNVTVKSYSGTTYIAYSSSITINQQNGTITLDNPTQVTSSDITSDLTCLNNKYFMTSTSSYVTSGAQAYLGDTTNMSNSWMARKAAYTITTKQDTITTTEEVKGDFVETLRVEDRIYPDNGKHTDGYWYVLNGYDGSSASDNSGEYTITVTGTGNDYCYLTINEEKVTTSGTYKITAGNSIKCSLIGLYVIGYVTVNGTTVLTADNPSTTAEYDYVPTGNATIALTSNSSACNIAITTT